LSEKFDKKYIYNFDETMIYRDSTGNYTITNKCTKQVIVKSKGK
jgi:hypothetical protein